VEPLPAVLRRGPAGTLVLAVDPGLAAFRGHFPGEPILPGVVQVDWAIRFGTELFGDLGIFIGLEHLKFQQVIRPGETIELRLDHAPDPGRLTFRFLGGGLPRASGSVLFARRGDNHGGIPAQG
jgi:hypothetical protein